MEFTLPDKVLNKVVEDMAHSIETIDRLQHQGYDEIFELVGNKLMSVQTGFYFYPDEFSVDQIIKIDRLGICYALSFQSGKYKGFFMAYVDREQKSML